MTELTKNQRRWTIVFITVAGEAVAFPRTVVVAGIVALAHGPLWAWIGAGMIVQTLISERWGARQMEREGLR